MTTITVEETFYGKYEADMAAYITEAKSSHGSVVNQEGRCLRAMFRCENYRVCGHQNAVDAGFSNVPLCGTCWRHGTGSSISLAPNVAA